MNSVVEVAAISLLGLNAATMVFHIKRDRRWARQEMPPVSVTNAENTIKAGLSMPVSNEYLADVRPLHGKTVVIAPDYKAALLWAETTGVLKADMVVCTQVEHMQGRKASNVVFLDWGWEHSRARRGQLAMRAETMANHSGGPVAYWTGI